MPLPPRTHCRKGHPLTEENTYLPARGGRMCRTCQRAYDRAWRQRNPDKEKEKNRRYKTENADLVREKKREWKHNHPNEVREQRRRNYLKNPDTVRNRNQRRRFLKANANVGFRKWMPRYFRYAQQNGCYYCGQIMFEVAPRGHPRKETLEHLIPLSRGGGHTWTNTALACSDCNCLKGNRTAEEFSNA